MASERRRSRKSRCRKELELELEEECVYLKEKEGHVCFFSGVHGDIVMFCASNHCLRNLAVLNRRILIDSFSPPLLLPLPVSAQAGLDWPFTFPSWPSRPRAP